LSFRSAAEGAGPNSVFAPFHEISPEEFQRVTEVTSLGFTSSLRCELLLGAIGLARRSR